MSLSPCACSVHTHCTFCDGKDTPQAMAAQAKLDAQAFNARKKEVR